MKKQYTYYAADFETTVFSGQEYTEVWSAAICKIGGSGEVLVYHTIEDFFNYLFTLSGNNVVYFHNLKFDGSFLLNYIIGDLNFKLAAEQIGSEFYQIRFYRDREMESNQYRYVISDRGQWYMIIIKKGRTVIEFRDSLKLLPFPLKVVGKAFKTEHQKLDMVYEGFRYAGCPITDEEMRYIKNDVLVLKEAIEFMFAQKHNKLTIGSCCYDEYKHIVGTVAFRRMFPDLAELAYSETESVDAFIRRSYRGGWCYLNPKYANQIITNGSTYDVNSLYPSQMHSTGGRRYPYGLPKIFRGAVPKECDSYLHYYYIRFSCRFQIKEGYLPFVQIKGNLLYLGTENLTTSNVYYRGDYHRYYMGIDGTIKEARVTLTMSQTDFILFQEHYNIYDIEYEGGVYFKTASGIFDAYINKYAELKMKSKGAMRTLAKLFLNNLYGKFAASTDSSFKVAVLADDGLEFGSNQANDKKSGYIAVGAAITSYSRDFTIRSAQKNYDNFVYADTDSIHMIGEANNLPVHSTMFNHWKQESRWDKGIFVRQKTYIEHICVEDGELVVPYDNIKCAGMPERCKKLLSFSFHPENLTTEQIEKFNPEQLTFIKRRRDYTDFKAGLETPGKLVPRQIRGGVVLREVTYKITKR